MLPDGAPIGTLARPALSGIATMVECIEFSGKNSSGVGAGFKPVPTSASPADPAILNACHDSNHSAENVDPGVLQLPAGGEGPL